MEITPTRYRQRPPEVDALELAPDTVEAVLTWLRSWGRDGFATGNGVRVAARLERGTTDEVAPGFDVPFGALLVRDVRTGGWAPVPRATLDAEYQSVRELERAAGAGSSRHRR